MSMRGPDSAHNGGASKMPTWRESGGMKRIILVLAAGYLGLALLGLYREQKGDIVCDCAEDCWCKKPGLSFFRWVFPVGHSLD